MARRSKRKKRRGRRRAGATAGAQAQQGLPLQAGPTESAGAKFGKYQSIGTVEIIHTTEKALLVRHDGADLWIAKSQVDGEPPVVGEIVELWVTTWIAKRLSRAKQDRRADEQENRRAYKAKQKQKRKAANVAATTGGLFVAQTARTSDYETPVNSRGEAAF